MKWMRLLVVSALAFGTVACGDDDVLPVVDAGGDDAGPTTDVPSLGDVGPGTDVGPDPDAGGPDAGPDLDAGGPDAGPGDAGGPDAGPGDAGGPDGGPDPDAGGPDAGPSCDMTLAGTEIDAINAAEEGDVSLPISCAYVTYLKPAVAGDDPGFFVQAGPTGPAVFVQVDPDGTVEVGDQLSLTATTIDISGDLTIITAASDVMVMASGTDLTGYVQDLSEATDLVTDLDTYISERVSISGIVVGAFAGAGGEFEAVQISTTGIDDDSDLLIRLPDTVVAETGLADGCSVTVDGVMGRFIGRAQITTYDAASVTSIMCPAPTVVGVAATDETTVNVTFSAALDMATVAAADFAITGGVTVSDAVVDGSTVTLTVADMVAGTDYTVTVTDVTDTFGTDIDAAANTAMFTGVGPDLGALLITEVVEGSGSGNKAIEITNVGAGVSNLASCVLARHANGAVVGSPLPDLTGTLAAGESFVACHSSFPDPTMTICDMVNSSINHNGNDAYSLTCDDVVVDTFGIAVRASSMDPAADTFSGTNGMGQALSGANMTLRRLCSVTGADADTDVTDAFDLGLQWDASTPADPTMSFDDFSGLGSHCP